MNHYASSKFWDRYNALPSNIRQLADEAYARLKEDPGYPSLEFKKLTSRYWSARVGDHYRAVAEPVEDGFMWVWIGTHEAYNRRL